MLNEAYKEKLYYSEKTGSSEPLFLSLLVGESSFMYAISTQYYKTIVELCHVELAHSGSLKEQLNDRLQFLIQHYGLNKKKFEKTFISLLTTDFSMIPEAYGNEQDLKAYLRFATGIATIKKSPLHHVKDLTFCYGIDQDLLNYLERTFVNASVRHSGAVDISLFFSQHSLVKSSLFLNIHDGQIELCARKQDTLLFYNLFNYSTNEDILYYLLFAMEQFALNPLDVKLSVAGQRAVTDELVKSIKKYIKQVSFAVGEPSVVLKGEPAALPQHYYFTLLNQHVCEL